MMIMLEKLKERIAEWIMPTVLIDPNGEVDLDPNLTPEEWKQAMQEIRTTQQAHRDAQ